MHRVRLLGRVGNISVLGQKTVLKRKVFTIEVPEKGNGIPCVTEGDRERHEVTKFNDFIMDGGCQYIEKAVAARWSCSLGILSGVKNLLC
jgi:hypothetical protein